MAFQWWLKFVFCLKCPLCSSQRTRNMVHNKTAQGIWTEEETTTLLLSIPPSVSLSASLCTSQASLSKCKFCRNMTLLLSFWHHMTIKNTLPAVLFLCCPTTMQQCEVLSLQIFKYPFFFSIYMQCVLHYTNTFDYCAMS